jgi:hypothetical protein
VKLVLKEEGGKRKEGREGGRKEEARKVIWIHVSNDKKHSFAFMFCFVTVAVLQNKVKVLGIKVDHSCQILTKNK